MKKLFSVAALTLCTLGPVFAADFSGTYQCHLNDHSDGPFEATLTLKLIKDASFPKTGYASYDITFDVPGIDYPYVGMAAARGNDLGLYFAATGPNKNPDDNGVGIASIIIDQDVNGKELVTLHKFYYEQSYKGKNNYGFENCVKIKQSVTKEMMINKNDILSPQQ